MIRHEAHCVQPNAADFGGESQRKPDDLIRARARLKEKLPLGATPRNQIKLARENFARCGHPN
jgi:hypothetical protein